tara:strand:- start:284 stop:1321 length:1038 start_codon:yes stop_codon:yes gene_type:complete
MGHRFDIITVGDENNTTIERQKGGMIIRLSNQIQLSTARLSFGMPLLFLRRLSKYDLIHFNAPNPLGELSFYIFRLLKRKKIKSVCSFHGEVVSAKPFYKIYNNFLLKSHLKACDGIIASSPAIVESTTLLDYFKSKVSIIPYGIDTNKFTPKKDWVRKNKSKSLKYLFVGRLVRYKGLFILLNAMMKSNGTLVIVGDGPLRNDLEKSVSKNKLQSKVKFSGKITDEKLLDYYQDSDVIVLPSIDRGESYGYALVEGMACGACAISTELGTGTSFVNIHKETGLVVKPGISEELVSAMKYLESNSDKLARYRKNALNRANKVLSKSKMLNSTIKLYENLGVINND